MTKTITITDLIQVLDGDICTVEIEGHQYTGPAYAGRGDILVWGGRVLRYSDGEPETPPPPLSPRPAKSRPSPRSPAP